MFNNEGPVVVLAMSNLTVRVFEHLETTSNLDIDKRINYKQIILRGTPLKKYKQVLAGYKDLEKGISGDQWNLGATKDVTL